MLTRKIFGCFALLVFALFSCKDQDAILLDPAATLTLRTDTMFFDTVFTAIPTAVPKSINKQFVVVNPHKEKIKTSFRLAGGSASQFRINVDGEVGPTVSEVEILPKDSVFVFVELTADPNNNPTSMPLIIRDSVEILTNGNRQHVQLVAWGQDAHYIIRDSVCNMVFDDKQKPYVVWGYLYVPENCQLTIKEGVKLHFAPRSWLYVEGTLKIEGTSGEPVKFEGDRLQPDFEESAGQWGGIWLNYLSKNNSIKHAEIKNGTVGVYCDSTSNNGLPNVVIENTEIRNMAYDGISGKGSYIRAINNVVVNCGRYTFLGLYGGFYDLKHCTFATYGYDFSHKDPTLVLNNIELDENRHLVNSFPIGFNIQNCIIEGSADDEFGFAVLKSMMTIDSTLKNNLIRATDKYLVAEIALRSPANVIDKGPYPTFEKPVLFVDARNRNYRIKVGSAAQNIGANVGITTDFDGNSRDGMPDAGAFEAM
ncbi:MAG: hypothetical protein H6607_00240 [Flavobacteriales bacterium]|nr:hypothetical protein [Flavobacteriales bacterium]